MRACQTVVEVFHRKQAGHGKQTNQLNMLLHYFTVISRNDQILFAHVAIE